MNPNRFTEKAQEAMYGAHNLAEQSNHGQIEPEHLALTLLEQQDGIVPGLVERLGHDPADLAGEARTLVDRLPRLGFAGPTGDVRDAVQGGIQVSGGGEESSR